MKPHNTQKGLASWVRNLNCVAVSPVLRSTNKPPWSQAMERHLSKLTLKQLESISHPTGPDDLRTILLGIQQTARSAKTAKFLEFLSTYTQTLQQFQGAIDIITGTNAGIIAPIWAPLKLVLIMLDTNSNALDMLASQLTLLSRKLPIYENYFRIFSSSEDLRNAIALVYADYLDFCVRAANYFGGNGIGNLFRSSWRPFSVEFKEVLASMESNINRVEDAVRVAAFTEQIAALNEQISTHQAVRREKVLRWLSPATFDLELSEFRRNRVPGTCHWIKDTSEYKEWLNGMDRPSILWLSWWAGYGKSFVAHSVRESLSGLPGQTLYFFFNSKQENSGKRSAIAFLRTIIHQLLTTLLDPILLETCFSILFPVVEKSGHNEAGSMEELWDAAAQIFRKIPQLHIILDGLDECNPVERIDLLQKLASASLSSNVPSTVKIIVTSRPELDILREFERMPMDGLFRLRFSRKNIDNDLKIYVNNRLLGSEIFGDKFLQKEIERKVLSRADGMFLYVRLLIDELESEVDIGGVRRRLKNLPKTLIDYYGSVIQNIGTRSPGRCQLARDIFLWTITTYRPLKVEELLYALDFQRKLSTATDADGEAHWPLIGDSREQIRKACFPLIEILEDDTVQIVHTSVTQFLLSHQINNNGVNDTLDTRFHYNASQAHNEVALVTLTVLSSVSGISAAGHALSEKADCSSTETFGNCRTDTSPNQSKLHNSHSFVNYCVMNCYQHVREAEAHFQDHRSTLLEFFQDGRAFLNWVQARRRMDFRFKIYFGLKSSYSRPPPLLHIAVYFNLASVVSSLIASGCSLEVQDGCGAFPLHVAAEQGYGSLVKILLDAGSNPLLQDRNGKTALHRAATKGHVTSVSHLTRLEINGQDRLRRSALYFASRYGRDDVVRKLLENGANPTCQSISGETALSVAVANGHSGVVRILLDTKLGFDHLADRQGLCHLVAARKGFTYILELLLHAGAPINVRGYRGWTLLHQASFSGFTSMVQLLLDSDADVQARGYDSNTPLHLASLNGHASVVEMLLGARCCPDTSGRENWTALHHASSAGHGAVVKVLLNGGADVHRTTLWGQTALQEAASNGHIPIVQELLEHNAKIDAGSLQDRSPLLLAASSGHPALVKMLLARGATTSSRQSRGRTALHGAAAAGHEDVICILLDAGADIHAKTSEGESALHEAASNGHGSVTKVLLRAGADPNLTRLDNNTALHLAAAAGHEAVVKVLLSAGVNSDGQTSTGHTAFQLATSNQHTAVCKLLESVKQSRETHPIVGGVDNSHMSPRNTGDLAPPTSYLRVGSQSLSTPIDFSEIEAFHRAVCLGDIAMVRLILGTGVDVNSKLNGNTTALHIAASHGNETVMEVLLNAGTDPSAANSNRETALHLAASGGHLVLVEQLLRAKADIHAITSAHETALHCASLRGHAEIVKVLLNCGASVDASDIFGRTALHKAASSGRITVIKILLEAGAAINVKRSDGWTALHHAAGGRHRHVAELLLKAGADVNVTDNQGRTALHIVSCIGYEGLVQILLEAGSEVDPLDMHERTPLHAACEKGYLTIVEELLDAGADDGIRDKDGKSPIGVAGDRNDKAILSLFA